MAAVEQIAGTQALVVEEDDPPLADLRAVTDLVGEAMGGEAHMIVVPVSCLAPEFFRLRSGFAGEMLQKLVNYRLKLALIGDVSPRSEASSAFRDLVRESNRGRDVWFLPDMAALTEKLTATTPARSA